MEINLRPYNGPSRWVFQANGALTGAMVTHIALRAINASQWSSKGLAIQAGVAFACSLIYPRIPSVVCIPNPFHSLALGLVLVWPFVDSTTANSLERSIFVTIVRLILAAGLVNLPFYFQLRMLDLFLRQTLSEADPKKVTQIVSEENKWELLRNLPHVTFTSREAAVAFADAFGCKKDVSPEEAIQMFTDLAKRFDEPLLSLDDTIYLSDTTRRKLLKLEKDNVFLTDPNIYKVLCFLATATMKNPLPAFPDDVKRVVAESPEFYGKVMGRWLTNDRLLFSIVKSLELMDPQLDKFGSSFMRSINKNQYRCLNFDRPSKSSLDGIIHALQSGAPLPAGNAPIQALSSTLVYESDNYSKPLKNEVIDPNDQLNRLNRNVVRHILTFLSPYDLIRSAHTCRRLYNLIVTQEGAPIWRAKKLGSLDAVRNMFHLAVQLESSNQKLVMQAFFLAVPSSLAISLGRIDKAKTLRRNRSPLVEMYCVETLQLPSVNQDCEIDEQEKPRLYTRYLRDEPDSDLLSLSDLGSETFDCLMTSGLPWDSIRPFCNKFLDYMQNNDPVDPVIVIEAKWVCYSIKLNHPHFDFGTIFPPEFVAELEEFFARWRWR